MKKHLLIINLLGIIFLTFLSGCKTNSRELTIEYQTTMYVNTTQIIKITNENEEIVSVVSANPNIISCNEGNILVSHTTGKCQITITSKSNISKLVEIMVIPRPKPTSLDFNINPSDNIVSNQTYQLYCEFEPLNSIEDVFWNYDLNNIELNEETLEITFLKPGLYTIVCYSDADIKVYKSKTFDVDFNPLYETYELLFIGNSLTKHDYSIPEIIKQMLLSIGVNANYVISPYNVWIIEHQQSFNQLMKTQRYTHVFLQEQSRGPITDYQKFASAVKTFNQTIQANKAQLVLYETWTYRIDYFSGSEELQKEMQQQLKEAYESVNSDVQGTISYVGEVFYRAIYDERFQHLSFYKDVSHPTIYGAYLSACVHYVTLTNRKASENPYIMEEISESDLINIQNIVDEYFEEN